MRRILCLFLLVVLFFNSNSASSSPLETSFCCEYPEIAAQLSLKEVVVIQYNEHYFIYNYKHNMFVPLKENLKPALQVFLLTLAFKQVWGFQVYHFWRSIDLFPKVYAEILSIMADEFSWMVVYGWLIHCYVLHETGIPDLIWGDPVPEIHLSRCLLAIEWWYFSYWNMGVTLPVYEVTFLPGPVFGT